MEKEYNYLSLLTDNYEIVYNENSDDFFVNVDGVVYPYEMTLSPEVPDDACCRVNINGEYYYFS